MEAKTPKRERKGKVKNDRKRTDYSLSSMTKRLKKLGIE
jgi:hypothetical protein